MVQIIQGGVKRPSSTEGFMQSVAPAATQAFDDYYKMSLADKMEGLKMQRKQEAEQTQRMQFAKQLQSQGYDTAAGLLMSGFSMDNIVNAAKNDPRIFMQGGQVGQGGQQGYQPNIGPQNMPFGYENQMTPIEDREAVEDMGNEQPIYSPKPQATPQPQVGGGLKGYEGFKKELIDRTARNFGLEQGIPFEQWPINTQKQISDEAKKLADSEANQSKASLAERTFQSNEKEKARKSNEKFTTSVRESLEKARKAETSLNNAEKIVKAEKVGPLKSTIGLISSENRAARASLETYNSGIVGFYKDLFPRLTEREFNYIADHWTLKPTNTKAANLAIIEAHRNMIKGVKDKQKIINKYMDKEGSLPPNVQNLVERDLGDENQMLESTLLSKVPPGTIATKEDVQNIAIELGTRDPNVIEKAMIDRGFTIP